MSQVQHDPEAVAKELYEAMMGQLDSIIEGSTEALQGPVRRITSNMARAARYQRPELVAACKDQLALVLQEQEMRVRGEAGEALEFLIDRGVLLLVNGAIAGLAGLRVTP